MVNKIFTNVQIFDGHGPDLYPGEVEVEGNRIVRIAKGAERLNREGAIVVDGQGATLMPGLVNTHGHLSYPAVPSLKDVAETPIEEHVLLASYNAKLVLDFGFTAVISGAAAKPRLDIVIRNEIEAGRLKGPRLLAATPELTVTGGLADEGRLSRDNFATGLVGDSPDDFRKIVRKMVREGVDLIKFNNSGDSFCYPRMPSDANPMTEDEVRTIVETTRNLGRRLAAHAHADSSVLQCLKYEVDLIYHATFVTDSTIEKLERVKDKFYITPAFGLRYNTLYEAADWGYDERYCEKIGNKAEFDACIENMSKLRKVGARVLPFGDYGFAWMPIGTDTRDFEHFINYFGFLPWEVLRAATAYGGEAFGVDKMGQVKAGFLADLILLDGNPLEDITLFQDQDNFLMIMKDGQYHKPPMPSKKTRRPIAAQ